MCSLEKPRMAKAKHKRDDEVDFGQSKWSVTQLVPNKHNTQLFSRFFSTITRRVAQSAWKGCDRRNGADEREKVC